ncbi:MAG TPA: heme exporter protein CcmB [Ktedonobacterales bacterium]|jgi:heme exporter protein B|nr:heme exporter protein CcmB [Ktedonobacterales bacterium]
MNTVTEFGRQVAIITGKDLRCELRTRQTWTAMGLFALLVLVVFNFAFDLRIQNAAAVAPGVLWIAFVFASVLGLGRTVAVERDQGALDRLLLCPVDRKAIYLAKVLGNIIFIGLVEVIAVPIFAIIYNVPVLSGALIPIVALGTIGIAGVGTLFAAMAENTRAREVLLPVLIFPLLIPVVIAAVRATSALILPVPGDAPWLGLIAAFDVIFISISTVMFEYVAED